MLLFPISLAFPTDEHDRGKLVVANGFFLLLESVQVSLRLYGRPAKGDGDRARIGRWTSFARSWPLAALFLHEGEQDEGSEGAGGGVEGGQANVGGRARL